MSRVWIILQKRTHVVLQEAAFPSRAAAAEYAKAAYADGKLQWYLLELPVLAEARVAELCREMA